MEQLRFSSSSYCSTSAKSPVVWGSGCLFSASPRSVSLETKIAGLATTTKPVSLSRFLWNETCSGAQANAMLSSCPWKKYKQTCRFHQRCYMLNRCISLLSVFLLWQYSRILECWGLLLSSRVPASLHVRQRCELLILGHISPPNLTGILSGLLSWSSVLLMMRHHLYLLRHFLFNWCSLGPMLFL